MVSMNSRQNVKDNDKLLSLLRQDKVNLKLPKSHFFQTKLKYFDQILIYSGFKTASKSDDAIDSTVLPSDSTQRDHFWAHVVFTKRFIKDFSIIAKIQNEYLRKDKELDWQDP